MSVGRWPSVLGAKGSPSDAVTALLYWALVLMALLNLHGVFHLASARPMLEGQSRAAWVLIGLCALLLALAARVPVHKGLGLPGFLFLCAISSYLGIGAVVNIWKTTDPFPIVPFLRYGVYFMVVVATAVATTTIAQRMGVVRLLRWILVVLALGCASVLATPWLVEFDPTGESSPLRNHGFYLQPNKAGRLAAMTAWLALALILCNGSRKLASFVLAVAVSAIFVTTSRSAIVVLFLLATLFVAYWVVLRPKITTGVILLSIVAAVTGGIVLLAFRFEAVILFAFNLPEKLGTLLELLSGNTNVVTQDMRWNVLVQTLQDVEAAPLVGSGFSDNHSVEGGQICGDLSSEFVWCGPHNLYLMLWREAGVVPVLLYLGYLLSMLGMSLGLPQRATTVTALGWTATRAFQDLFSDNGFEMLWLGCFSGLTFGLLMHEAHQQRTAVASAPSPVP